MTICERSFQSAVTKAQEDGKPASHIRVIGKIAYCNAMPRPFGASNIREFIACALYGMCVDIISGPEGTRLRKNPRTLRMTASALIQQSTLIRPIQRKRWYLYIKPLSAFALHLVTSAHHSRRRVKRRAARVLIALARP